jgi:ABC-type branched-subunit amino acid transport system ATPase component
VALLETRDVAVSFGGVMALGGVDISVEEGRVTGLIGPNGAGKTTLFNVINGLQVPQRGRVLLAGRDITQRRPYERARLGLGRTFQRLEAFGTMTVRENLLVAAEAARSWRRSTRVPEAVVDEIAERVGLAALAGARVDTLSTGTGRLVELGRAMACDPRVLLLDEPSSGLDRQETEAFGVLVTQIAASGVAVLLVEHDTTLVMSTCAHIFVLDFGHLLAEGSATEVQADEKVRAAYLGQARTVRTPADVRAEPRTARAVPAHPVMPVTPAGPAAPPRLELRGIRAGYGSIEVLHGVDLAVGAGQVFALLGANGVGKSTALKVASGQIIPQAGDVMLAGHRVTGTSSEVLARLGVCTIPEGRGVFPNLTVAENLLMATYGGISRADVTEKTFARFPRLGERRRQLAGTLSGGEQQMLAMARALVWHPAVLILDELSSGLAPRVVSELYEVVAGIAAGDVSVLLVEQFAYEVLGVADAAAVMVHGRIQMTGSPAAVAEVLSDTYLSESTA